MLALSLLHAVVAITLAIYGANALLLTLLYLRRRRQAPPAPPQPAEWPAVTVQAPVFNELHVVERLIHALAALDYPRDRLQIQVLDDSTDETTALAAACIERYRAQGLDIELVHRQQRPGFKAGALAAAMSPGQRRVHCHLRRRLHARARLSAPHRALPAGPAASWLHPDPLVAPQRPLFAVDPGPGAGAGRPLRGRADCAPAQRLVVRLQRHRRPVAQQCIDDAGGWQTDTLCEDLDLSYRAQLRGWQGLYLPDVDAPAEIPPQLAALKRQQSRWATGSIQTFRKLAGQVAGSPRPLAHKVEGLIHLGAYFCHPLMMLLLLLTLPLLWFGDTAANPLRWLLAYLGLASVGPPLLYAVSQWELHRGQGWLRRLAALPLLVLMGTGLALSNTAAVARGLSRQPAEFRRTPKFHVQDRRDQWQNKRYTLPLSWLVLGETVPGRLRPADRGRGPVARAHLCRALPAALRGRLWSDGGRGDRTKLAAPGPAPPLAAAGLALPPLWWSISLVKYQRGRLLT